MQKRYLGPQRRKAQNQPRRANRYQAPKPQNRPTVSTRDRLKDLFCRNCSKHAGKPKYHYGPYGGTSNSKCGFTKTGTKRSKEQGFGGFIRQLFGEDVADYDEEMIQMIDVVFDSPDEDGAVMDEMNQVEDEPEENQPFYPF